MKKTLYTCLISVFAAIQSANIQAITTCNDFGHFDLYINVDPPASDGGSLLIDSIEQFSVEASTGRTIVSANFGDFPGGPHKTDDPGWVVGAGDLLGGEFLWFRALGPAADSTQGLAVDMQAGGVRERAWPVFAGS